MERVVPVSHDAERRVQDVLAGEIRREGLVGVQSAAVHVGLAVRQQPDPLLVGGGLELQFNAGKGLVEAGDRARQYGLHPHRPGRDAVRAGSPGHHREHDVFRVLDFSQQAPGQFGHDGSELGEADSRWDAFEQPAPELFLELADDT